MQINEWKKWLARKRVKYRARKRQFKLDYKKVEVEFYDVYKAAVPFFRALNIVLLIAALLSLITSLGFQLQQPYAFYNEALEYGIIIGFAVLFLGRLILTTKKREMLKARLPETILFIIVLFMAVIWINPQSDWVQGLEAMMGQQNVFRLGLLITKGTLIFLITAKFVQITPALLAAQRHPGQVLVGSFFVLILVGTFFLMLPNSTVDNQGLGFVNALFTSTSAVCVTGLIVVDTATHFTTMGQTIIMILFQLGGIGIVTFTTFFALFVSGGLGIGQMTFLRDVVSESNIKDTLATVKKIIGMTFTIEAIGFVGYFLSWTELIPDPGERFFFSLFHAISAFCNAGFSLFTESLAGPANALNWGINITTVILIIVGGLGFTTLWELLMDSPFRQTRARRLSVHAKLVVTMTAILVIGGTIFIWLFEKDGQLAGYTMSEQFMLSLFQSVTTRTAGFNTMDIGAMGISSTMIMLLLMAIGASPASTGGGIKTTTVAVLVLAVRDALRGHNRTEYNRRTIPPGTIYRALTAFVLAAGGLFISTLLLTVTETHSFVDLLFEEISAYSTVGLSRGITSALSDPGKIIVILSMFVGRVGSVTVGVALVKKVDKRRYRYPKESIIVA
jgi:trk system potassium uptake protein TrkH